MNRQVQRREELIVGRHHALGGSAGVDPDQFIIRVVGDQKVPVLVASDSRDARIQETARRKDGLRAVSTSILMICPSAPSATQASPLSSRTIARGVSKLPPLETTDVVAGRGIDTDHGVGLRDQYPAAGFDGNAVHVHQSGRQVRDRVGQRIKAGQAGVPPHQNLAVGLDGDGMPAVARRIRHQQACARLGIGADDSELVVIEREQRTILVQGQPFDGHKEPSGRDHCSAPVAA